LTTLDDFLLDCPATPVYIVQLPHREVLVASRLMLKWTNIQRG